MKISWKYVENQGNKNSEQKIIMRKRRIKTKVHVHNPGFKIIECSAI
jgi:hypothetical protein